MGLNEGEPCKWGQCNHLFGHICYKGKCHKSKMEGERCDENNPCFLNHICDNGVCLRNCYYEDKVDQTQYNHHRKNLNNDHKVQDGSDQTGYVIPKCTQNKTSYYRNCLPANGNPNGCLFRYPTGTFCSINSECTSNSCDKRPGFKNDTRPCDRNEENCECQ